MGEVADEEFVDEVDGPEDIMDDHQEKGMVVVPADEDGVDAEDGVEYTGVAVVHISLHNKKRAY
jgi:hypothetical protein